MYNPLLLQNAQRISTWRDISSLPSHFSAWQYSHAVLWFFIKFYLSIIFFFQSRTDAYRAVHLLHYKSVDVPCLIQKSALVDNSKLLQKYAGIIFKSRIFSREKNMDGKRIWRSFWSNRCRNCGAAEFVPFVILNYENGTDTALLTANDRV